MRKDDCSCQTVPAGNWETAQKLVAPLAAIRDKCSALQKIIIPDEIWEEYYRTAQQPYDQAFHGYAMILALTTGRLPQWTTPIHNFLLIGSEPRQELSAQYRRDLQERWMLAELEGDRHDRSKRFHGKHLELQFARWLEDQGWNITGLEALGAANDIQSCTDSGTPCALELKYIQQQKSNFERNVEGLATGEFVFLDIDVPGARNWLVYRAYEAAKQFESVDPDTRKIAVVVISYFAWYPNYDIMHFYGNRKELAGIDWNQPFFSNGSSNWDKWFTQQKDKPDNQTLKAVLSSLDELWILIDPLSEGPRKEFNWVSENLFQLGFRCGRLRRRSDSPIIVPERRSYLPQQKKRGR